MNTKAECPYCAGSGLYQGFMERPDEAVVCVACGGAGSRDSGSKKFVTRHRKLGVTKIRGGSGTILDDPRNATWISYEEFERRIPSPKAD